MMKKFNQFHMVSESPWPIISSIQIQTTMLSMTSSMSKKTHSFMSTINLWTLMMISLMWWKNTSSESNKEGFHQKSLINGIKMGMLLFISSEVLFFTSFFWSYFHFMSSPNMEIGHKWPPMGINSFDPINVPLLNTMILVSSGFSITWSHHLLMENKMKKAKNLLLITCLLGGYFSILQKMEYDQSLFSMADSSYGTIFFMATGFHGIHVLIGTTFLLSNLWMMKKMLVNNNRHMGFELAAWYWHFVDVVWLMLYLSFYWWGK